MHVTRAQPHVGSAAAATAGERCDVGASRGGCAAPLALFRRRRALQPPHHVSLHRAAAARGRGRQHRAHQRVWRARHLPPAPPARPRAAVAAGAAPHRRLCIAPDRAVDPAGDARQGDVLTEACLVRPPAWPGGRPSGGWSRRPPPRPSVRGGRGRRRLAASAQAAGRNGGQGVRCESGAKV